MKKVGIVIAVLLLLLIGAVLIGPGLIDWNDYRGRIAGEVERVTGRPAAIEGDITLAVLPVPHLSAESVRIANPAGFSDRDMLSLKRFEAQVALFPLLGGRMQVESFRLVEPVIALERLKDGRANWDFTSGPPASAPKPAAPGGLDRSGPSLAFDRIVIENGTISYRDGAAGAAYRAEKIDAQLSADSLKGPFRGEGSVVAQGVPLKVDLDLGRVGSPAPASVQLTAALPDREASLRFDGILITVDDTRLDGTVRIQAPNLRESVAKYLGLASLPPALSGPLDLRGNLLASAAATSLSGATLSLGSMRATGSFAFADGTLTIERASATLPGESELRLSARLKSEKGLPAAEGQIEAHGESLRNLLDWAGVTQVAAIPPDRLAKFAASADFAGAPGNIRLSGLEATLDGTKISGALAYTDQGRPGYGVRLAVDRVNLDSYLPAQQAPAAPTAGTPSPAPPAGPGARPGLDLTTLDANVAIEVANLTYQGIAMKAVALDAALFKGGLTLRTARIADVAGLALSAEGSAAALAPLKALDLRLTAVAKSLEPAYRAFKIDPPVPAAMMEAVDLKLHLTGDEKNAAVELASAVAGGSVEAGGTVANPLSRPSYDLKLRVKHPELARLLAKASPGYRPGGRDLKGVDLYAAATGSADAVSLKDLQGQAGPVAIKGSASANWAGDRPKVSAQLQTSEIDLNQLLPAATGAQTKAPAAGRPAAAAAGQRWSSEPIDVDWVRAADAEVKLTAAALVYDRYRVTDPALAARLEKGALVLEQLDGGLFGGKIGLKGRLEAPDPNAPPRLAAQWTVVKAQMREALDKSSDIDVTGVIDLDGSIAAQGRSEAEMARSLSGTSKLAVRDGTIRGFDLKAMSDRLGNLDRPKDFLGLIGQSMSGGQTRFSALTGSFAIERGVARTDDLRLNADGGEGTARGSIDIAAWTMDMETRFRLTEHGNAPGFGMRLTGPLDRPQRAFDTTDLSAYVAERVTKEVLKKAAPNLNIPGLTAPSEGKQGKQPQAEQVIRGLLDTLRR